jgi:O-antigen/teichoic acid export membrane protein
MPLYKRELIINVSFLILANLLIKPYYIFFIERRIQNAIGTEAWGIYFTLFSMSMVPQILLDMGLTSFINQRLSSNRNLVPYLWSNTVWLKPILALLFGLVYLILSYASGYWKTHHEIIFWIGLNQMLLSLILFLRAFVSGLGHYRWDSILSVGDKFLFILVFTLGVVFNQVESIHTFLWIQTTSLLVPCMIAGGWIYFDTKVNISLFRFSSAIQLIKQSLPYAGIFLLMILFCRMEPVWISILRPLDGALQAGIYAAAYRLLDAANMMGFLFAGLLLPMFSHAMVTHEKKEYQSIFNLAGKVMYSLAVLIGITVMSEHKAIMELLYKDHYPDILHIVILNLIPLTINYLLSTLLTAAGKAGQMNMIFLLSIGINIIAHLFLTPGNGAAGAAYAALITQGLTVMLLSYLIIKNGLIRFSIGQFTFIAGGLMIMMSLAYLYSFLALPPLFRAGLLFVSGSIIYMLTGILPLRSILRLMKSQSI